MDRRKMFRVLLLSVVVLLMLSIFAGCSSDNEEGSGNTGNTGNKDSGGEVKEEDEAPFELSMMTRFNAESQPSDDNEFILKLEEVTNTELDIRWVSREVYSEMVNVTLASGELPKVLMVEDYATPNMISSARAGVFWDLEPYLDEFPNLASFNEIALNNSRLEGSLYGIIRPRAIARDGMVVRQDWLDNVGLETPTTIDEIYDMLVAFRDEDPDQNGQDDTYGLMVESALFWTKEIQAWFGGPNEWKVENGSFIKAEETPEYLEHLKFLKKLYDEDLMNKNFALTTAEIGRKDLFTNVAGANHIVFDHGIPVFNKGLEQAGTEGSYTAAVPIDGVAGKRSMAHLGFSGMFFIPKSSVPTEDELRKVLAFFDKQREPAVEEELFRFYLDYEHQDLIQIIATEFMNYPLGEGPSFDWVQDKVDEMSQYAVSNPTIGLISDTMAERGSELDAILHDAETKFIMGDIDEAGWEKELDNWRKNGGTAAAAEYSAQYNQ